MNYYFRKGFTLVETVVTVAIFTLAMTLIIVSLLVFYRSNTYVMEQSFAINNARKGVEFMVEDIREAAFSESGSYPVISAASTTISFYSDIDTDNETEQVRYFLNGTNLEKGVIGPTGNPALYNPINEEIQTVSQEVRNGALGIDIFEYYDSTGALVADLNQITDIAYIRVNLVINVNPVRLPNDFTLRSSVTLRNLKD